MQLVINCMENLPNKIISESLTYDDVLLVPGYSNILPRDVKISSRFSKNISLGGFFMQLLTNCMQIYKLQINHDTESKLKSL